MSQHDYVIDNQTGAGVRSDINAVLAAIVSQNSGATAPTTTFAYQFWADTTTGLLKQRNAANTDWVTLGTMADATLGLLSRSGGNMTGAINEARSTVASATTPDIWTGTGNNIDYTGTVTATGFAAAPQAGASRVLDCAAAAVFTAGANMLIDGVASGSNLTVAAGDRVEVFARTTTQFVLRINRNSAEASWPQDFRLTLTSGTPVTTADVTAATTVYCTPYRGNKIALWNGTAWQNYSSAEFSIALGTLVSGKAYDVFCYQNAGVPTLELGTAWTNDTTRAVALAYQNGILVKSGDATRRYLGTFYTTATTTTEDSQANRYLYNYYNKVSRTLKRLETTASWAYTTFTWRHANGSAANQLNFILGVAEDSVSAKVLSTALNSSAPAGVWTGIALDSTSVPDRQATEIVAAAGGLVSIPAENEYMPTAGRHFIAWLEQAQVVGTATFYGSTYQCGITGRMMA